MASQFYPNRPADTDVRLADGGLCRIRPSSPADRELLEACFNALSPESWQQRFFTGKHPLSVKELDHLAAVDGRDHLAFAALRIDEAGRELAPLGFARCLRLGAGSDQAELAVTVADAAQRQGIGSALLERLMQAAGEQGIRAFRCEVLTANHGMRRLAQVFGGAVNWSENGVLEYQCAVPAPPPAPIPARDLPWYLDPGALPGGWFEPALARWFVPAGPPAIHAWLTLVDDCLTSLRGGRTGAMH